MTDKKSVIKAIELFADLLEFAGANKFKISAFKNGANALRRVEQDLSKMVQNGSLKEVKGIGKGLFSFIEEIVNTGASIELDEILADLPDGLPELFSIRGLGAKKIKQLSDELGINSIDMLEQACLDGSIEKLKGFTAKTSEKLINEIKTIRQASQLLLLNRAENQAENIREQIKNIALVDKIELTGELRRIREVISKIEFCVLVSDILQFGEELSKLLKFKRLEDEFSSRIYELIEVANVQVLLYVIDAPANFESLLFATTGSDEFISRINKSENPIDGKSEEEIFGALNVDFVIPEMREVELFDAPEHLRKSTILSQSDFQGMLHFHTTFSDGMNTLEEMKEKAKEIGYKFMAVCDHSKSAFYANGLKEDRLILQKEEIEKQNEIGKDFLILQGIESDILRDGSLDYENDVLKNFDFIVASVHSQFTLTEDEMTNRIIKVIENPYTNLLGHPTGRLLLSRDSYKVNMIKVIDACAENNVAIEINSSPHRLDLDWRLIYYAREKGCRFGINADAHSTMDIENTKYGIKIARKGGIQPEEVINCFDIDEFKKFCNK